MMPVFVAGRPFYTMVTTFLASAVGLGPMFDPNNPLRLDHTQAAVFTGKVEPLLAIDMQQVLQPIRSGALTANEAVNALCCMLANSAYEVAKPQNDKSPEFEAFRHIRNAASHRNRFSFDPEQPSRPAVWRTLVLDHTKQGASNPLQGTQCFGNILSPADAIGLLWDIEQRLS
jgi:hypothetical protein